MRLFHSEMLQTLERQPSRSPRGPVYGSRYDRRAQRTRVPALALEFPPEPVGITIETPRDILFRIADLERAA
jgi:hypothetical protein